MFSLLIASPVLLLKYSVVSIPAISFSHRKNTKLKTPSPKIKNCGVPSRDSFDIVSKL
jgi:hypothetical protein